MCRSGGFRSDGTPVQRDGVKSPVLRLEADVYKRQELECGDIGAIGKMEKVKTGDTLSDPRKVVKLEPIPFPCLLYTSSLRIFRRAMP